MKCQVKIANFRRLQHFFRRLHRHVYENRGCNCKNKNTHSEYYISEYNNFVFGVYITICNEMYDKSHEVTYFHSGNFMAFVDDLLSASLINAKTHLRVIDLYF